jgi:hypothetical protein
MITKIALPATPTTVRQPSGYYVAKNAPKFNPADHPPAAFLNLQTPNPRRDDAGTPTKGNTNEQ